MDWLKNGTNLHETSATLQVRVLFSGCGWCTASSDVWDPATESPGDGGDHDGREEKTISMGKITGKSWEHDDGMMINDHILGCQICSHTSIIVRNPDQI